MTRQQQQQRKMTMTTTTRQLGHRVMKCILTAKQERLTCWQQDTRHLIPKDSYLKREEMSLIPDYESPQIQNRI